MWHPLSRQVTCETASKDVRIRPRRGSLQRVAVLATSIATVVGATAGCAAMPLWRSDRHVVIVTPHQLQLVTSPMTLAWRASALPSRARQYAVFIDRTPIQPGQSLSAIAANDRSCRRTPGCPDVTYLRAHNIFLTAATSVVVPYLAQLGGITGRDQPSVHRATIVLIDATGHRFGEYAYTVAFRMADNSA